MNPYNKKEAKKMDLDKVFAGRGTAIEKLKESNVYVWKQKINLILTSRGVEHVLLDTKKSTGRLSWSSKIVAW